MRTWKLSPQLCTALWKNGLPQGLSGLRRFLSCVCGGWGVGGAGAGTGTRPQTGRGHVGDVIATQDP